MRSCPSSLINDQGTKLKNAILNLSKCAELLTFGFVMVVFRPFIEMHSRASKSISLQTRHQYNVNKAQPSEDGV